MLQARDNNEDMDGVSRNNQRPPPGFCGKPTSPQMTARQPMRPHTPIKKLAFPNIQFSDSAETAGIVACPRAITDDLLALHLTSSVSINLHLVIIELTRRLSLNLHRPAVAPFTSTPPQKIVSGDKRISKTVILWTPDTKFRLRTRDFRATSASTGNYREVVRAWRNI